MCDYEVKWLKTFNVSGSFFIISTIFKSQTRTLYALFYDFIFMIYLHRFFVSQIQGKKKTRNNNNLYLFNFLYPNFLYEKEIMNGTKKTDKVLFKKTFNIPFVQRMRNGINAKLYERKINFGKKTT